MSKCLSDRKESECVSTDGSQRPIDQTAEADTEEGMSDRRNAGRLLKSLSKMWKAFYKFLPGTHI